jgi:hypothetical protein
MQFLFLLQQFLITARCAAWSSVNIPLLASKVVVIYDKARLAIHVYSLLVDIEDTLGVFTTF